MKSEILRLQSVTQKSAGVTLLDQFNLHIYKGEIMGLLPLNTHGIDQLLDVICQNTSISSGRIYFNEEEKNYPGQGGGQRNRVHIIEKTNSLARNLTVADNIFVLRKGFKMYVVNNRVLSAQARQLAAETGVTLDPGEVVSRLSPLQCCIVELLKGLAGGAKLFVLRDISNFLSSVDLLQFQKIMLHYREKGISFLYIGNHHEDVFKICDRTALMKNGRILKVLEKREFLLENLLPFILDYYLAPPARFESESPLPVLQFENVDTGRLHSLSFSVKQGECVVLLDMNNTVLLDILGLMNGELVPDRGRILFDGRPYTHAAARHALQKGIAFIPEAPTRNILFPEMSYLDNLCFLLDKRPNSIRLTPKVKNSIAKEYRALCGPDILAPDITGLEQASLYNLAYFRVHLHNPKIVFCVQPFSGADMYLRQHLVTLLDKLKERGMAVVILAVSISDTLAVANRLVTIQKGRVVREYDQSVFRSIDPDELVNGNSAQKF